MWLKPSTSANFLPVEVCFKRAMKKSNSLGFFLGDYVTTQLFFKKGLLDKPLIRIPALKQPAWWFPSVVTRHDMSRKLPNLPLLEKSTFLGYIKERSSEWNGSIFLRCYICMATFFGCVYPWFWLLLPLLECQFFATCSRVFVLMWNITGSSSMCVWLFFFQFSFRSSHHRPKTNKLWSI